MRKRKLIKVVKEHGGVCLEVKHPKARQHGLGRAFMDRMLVCDSDGDYVFLTGHAHPSFELPPRHEGTARCVRRS